MGYFRNHLATLVMGVFSAILTGLWPVFVDFAPILNFVFIMAVPIAWFITFMCWIVQKGADYSHKYSAENLKKNYNNPQSTVIKYTAEGKQVSTSEIKETQTTQGNEPNELENLKQEKENLQTMAQIEELKSELANLKALASQEKKKRKSKKK